MPDDNSLFERVRDRVAALASTEDNNPSPQARDEDPFVVGREEFREEVDKNEIDRFIREYNRNPLIRVPIQNFAADVLEPGVSASVDIPEDMDMDMPTVPESATIPATYHGQDLDDALESWMATAYIDGFSFDASLADLLEQIVKDRRGRRGTAVVEHAYDDPRERDRLMALRPIKTETLTFYQREGKRIVLREDDDATEFDSVSISDRGDPTRTKAPTTPAGKTAAAAQFDDIFGGSQEHDEIPFALSDLTITAFDADTGDLLGRPDSATVLNRAASLRKKMRHVDQSVLNTAFGNVIATVESQDAEVVRQVRDNLDVNVKERNEDIDPETVSATNAPVEIEEIDSSVPDVTDIIQQEIEFILTALPTPLYRVGFAGDINRDVTSEQGEDYRDAVNRERRHLESTFSKPLEMKAREWMHGDPHSTQPLDVDVRLRIRPSQADSPLRDEEFDASEFSNLASALKQVAPGGEVAQLMPAHEIREMLLDINPELPDPPESAASEPDLSLPSETDDEIQQTFDDLFATASASDSDEDDDEDDDEDEDDEDDEDGADAQLATRYTEGDVVQSPQGLGIISGVETEPFTGKGDEEIDASESSPTYIVALKDARVGSGFYSASELDETEMPDTGVDDPEAMLSGHLASASSETTDDADLVDTTFDIPESWDESPKPNRLILLDAWSSMGGTFTAARETLGSKRLAASMKDRVLGYEGWREGG